jgi:hypothetical protein
MNRPELYQVRIFNKTHTVLAHDLRDAHLQAARMHVRIHGGDFDAAYAAAQDVHNIQWFSNHF